MAGINPYSGGAWTPNYSAAVPSYSPYANMQPQVPPHSMQIPAGYSSTAPLYGRQGRNNMPRVSGPESAKAFPMNPGDEIVVFDANDPVFYFLSADDSGFKQMKTFEFHEKAPDVLEVQPQIDEAAFPDYLATKEDLESLREQVGSFSSDLAKVKEMLEGLVN